MSATAASSHIRSCSVCRDTARVPTLMPTRPRAAAALKAAPGADDCAEAGAAGGYPWNPRPVISNKEGNKELLC